MFLHICIEELIFNNFISCFVLLSFTNQIMKYNIKFKSLLIIAFLMFLGSFLSFYIELGSVSYLIIKILLSFILCLLLNFKKSLNNIIKFFIVFSIFKVSFFCVYVVTKNLGLCLWFGFYCIILYFLIKLIYSTLRFVFYPYLKNERIECKIVLGTKELKINAFLDTGNLLKDAKSNLPVVICEIWAFNDVFSKEDFYNLLSFKEIERFENFHYITYTTINGKQKKIAIFKPNNFFIKNLKGKYVKCDCFVGLEFNKIFYKQNYQALIGLDLVGGVM